MRTLKTLMYKGKKHFVHQETESFFLISKNGKEKIFSLSKNEYFYSMADERVERFF
jgi:hypothetical protein